MKRNKKAAIALSIAAVMACGALAGCDLTSINVEKNMKQVIAEVNITQSDDFAAGGDYVAYKDVIQPATVLKRDLIAEFMTRGYSLQQQGVSYADVFKTLVDSLVNRQIYLQYAVVYFLDNSPLVNEDDASSGALYTVSGYNAYVASEKAKAEQAGYSADIVDMIASTASYAYFLDEEERALTDYTLRRSLNRNLDSEEKKYIKEEEDEHDHDEDTRTIPTGVNADDEEYCPEHYEIYTGHNHVSECGDYEAQDGSTPTTRKRAYGSFLSTLRSNYLLANGEDTTKFENLSYYHLERKISYESAMIKKLNEIFEDIAEEAISANDYEYVMQTLSRTYQAQKSAYSDDTDAFEKALDSVSDNNFLFYAPNDNYGFVINILLPFSDASSQALTDSDGDYGDLNGNKFQRRAKLLEKLTAIDQRGSWFTGHEDYSFIAGDDAYKGTLGNDADRTYLFFEECLSELEANNLTGTTKTKYNAVKNYYGRYTYNGKVTAPEEGEGNGHYKLVPKKINIDEFIVEMEGYLRHVGLTLGTGTKADGYYNRTPADYYHNGTTQETVNYAKFLYYKNKVNFSSDFDPNNVFLAGTQENTAMAVINELSFAYNTDTAGLNKYLGYAVSPYKTNFVKEFEYAAQLAVAGGAGTYTVAPSDYGWHIMYCTFAYNDKNADGYIYAFNANDVEKDGTFSYRYFEALKASTAETYANVITSKTVTAFISCAKIYEKRYKDLLELDKA